jgi:phosphoribosylformylglycinamidine synthase
MTMLQLAGPAAETAFRLSRLRERVHDACDAALAVGLDYLHFIHTDTPLSESQLAVLQALLRYGEPSAPLAQAAAVLYVVPRLGTISPWASKATDIARSCGLPVARIERGRVLSVVGRAALGAPALARIAPLIHDRMTESCLSAAPTEAQLFVPHAPRALERIDALGGGTAALAAANEALGLALSDAELQYLAEQFVLLDRNPTDVELMMFAQANSEHCRHKVFNADWIIDDRPTGKTLFRMIKNTYAHAPQGVLSAYQDNAAVVAGPQAAWFWPDAASGLYAHRQEPVHVVMKVETHNHPTAISPFPGAATGSGGEIRDEGATGRGAKPKAGLTGFTVSHLELPDWPQPWEQRSPGRPERIASPLAIMLEGPIGAAQFNNEFGRPNINGYFRTCLMETPDGWRGYHKPIMLAGGLGNIRAGHVEKGGAPVGAKIIVLGGPAMLIGLGGGAASSQRSGAAEEGLDFASVQRGNPEMQRRAQEVIDTCSALGAANPIISIHDVGAGGLSNAVPEIVEQSGHGAVIELREVPNDDPGMSPLELWCNESQERYVLTIAAEDVARFVRICERERCPLAVIGELTAERDLVVNDRAFKTRPVAMPMATLFGLAPKMTRHAVSRRAVLSEWQHGQISIADALERVLRFPAVADKSFLIHIGDRTVGGLVVHDPLVGPWQVPVADVGVTASSFQAHCGEAIALGERTPVAVHDGPASARLAVAEAVTNIAAADVAALGDIRLSANWMAAAGHVNDDYTLYEMVKALGEELCPALGIAIPVGKDSLSMRTDWTDAGGAHSIAAPASVVISAFAPVLDVRRTLTPELSGGKEETVLLLLDLADGKTRLGGSVLAQCYNEAGGAAPDLDDPEVLVRCFAAQRALREAGLLLAYHDRADGGLLVTLLEMAFAGHRGLDIEVPDTVADPLAYLFAEELGIVVQLAHADLERARALLAAQGFTAHALVARPRTGSAIAVRHRGNELFRGDRIDLHRMWSELSFRMQALRDDPQCAEEAYESLLDAEDPGLNVELTFAVDRNAAPRAPRTGPRPKVAVLREQGVNGQREMAATLDRAGFAAYDVHMSDLLAERMRLEDFRGIVACGGFSYGDVLGAGEGWAKAILYRDALREQFAEFFARADVFALGVCNGCQMLAALKELIPGTEHWPRFGRNRSAQFEGRLSLVRIESSPSVLLRGMAGSRLPIVTSHGEGRADFATPEALAACEASLTALRYVTTRGEPAVRYPANPNGSPHGIAGLANADGRVTIMMPHPERVFRTVQCSWHPSDWGEESPWQAVFDNARRWVDTGV